MKPKNPSIGLVARNANDICVPNTAPTAIGTSAIAVSIYVLRITLLVRASPET